MKFAKVIAMLFTLGFAAQMASAADRVFTWTGNGGDGKWSNPDNWETTEETIKWPKATGDHTPNMITINADQDVTIDVDVEGTKENFGNGYAWANVKTLTITGDRKVKFTGDGVLSFGTENATGIVNQTSIPVELGCKCWINNANKNTTFDGPVHVVDGGSIGNNYSGWGIRIVLAEDAEFAFGEGSSTSKTLEYIDMMPGSRLYCEGGEVTVKALTQTTVDTDNPANVYINSGTFNLTADSTPKTAMALTMNGGKLIAYKELKFSDYAFDGGALYCDKYPTVEVADGFTIGGLSGNMTASGTITCNGDLYIDTISGTNDELVVDIAVNKIIANGNTVYTKGLGTVYIGGMDRDGGNVNAITVVATDGGEVDAADGSYCESMGENIYAIIKIGKNEFWCAGNGDWSNSYSWICNVSEGVPSKADDVVIFWRPGEGEFVVNLDMTIACKNIYTMEGAANVRIVGVDESGVINHTSGAWNINGADWTGSKLTFENITFTNTGSAANFYGEVVFNNVTYSNGYAANIYGDFTINGGTFTNTGTGAGGGALINSGAKLTIEDGVVTLKDTKFIGKTGENKGEMVVNGGTVSCTGFWSDEYTSGLYAYLTINGGIFTTTATKAPISNDTMLLHAKVTGGLFNATSATWMQCAYGSSLEITGGEVYAPKAELRTLSKDGNSAFKMSGGKLTVKDSQASESNIFDNYDITGGTIICTNTGDKFTLNPANVWDVPFFNALATQTGFTLETYSAPTFAVGGTYEIDGTLIMTNASSLVVLQGNTNGALTTFKGKGTIVADHVFAGSSRHLEFDGVNLVLNNAAHGVSSYYNIENGNGAATYSNMTFFVGRDNTTGWTIEKNKDTADRYMVINGTVVFNTDNFFDRSTGAYNVYIGAGFRTGTLNAEGYDQAVFFTRGRGTIHYTGYAKSTNMSYVKVIATDSNNVLNLDDSTILPTSGVLSAKTLMIDKDPAITLKTTNTTEGRALLTDTGWTEVPEALSVVDGNGNPISVELKNGTLQIVGVTPEPVPGFMFYLK